MSVAAAIILAVSGPAAAEAPSHRTAQRPAIATQSSASVTVRRAERIDFTKRKSANREQMRVRTEADGDVYFEYR